MKTKEEVLQECTVEGNNIKLPPVQLDRKLYTDVAKSLELIGGKWKGGKVMAFIFPQDPTDLLAEVAAGGKRNLKKEFQFFATPDKLADRLVELANITSPEMLVLEPSAGQGAIVHALLRAEAGLIVHAFELMDVNRIFLSKIKDCVIVGEDFLGSSEKDGVGVKNNVRFDRIVANPPFAKNQDIDHIYEMYGCLKSGGRLVTVASRHWLDSNNRKETEFRMWLQSLDSETILLDAGEFSESGTKIATCIIVINK